jgi:glutamate/tyrosine decarboxylase-like PLP-dependent enzyme
VIDSGRDELDSVLASAHEAARTYLRDLDGRPARSPRAEDTARAFSQELPERGAGAQAALEELVALADETAIASAGPRFFHFVIGGVTPAALAADWVTSALDQNAFAWVSSPLASRLEAVSLGWLKELFGLPPEWGGVITTGATAANFACLAAARGWWARQHGVDVDSEGLAALPRVPVLAGGYVHASAIKALAMLGLGRSSVRVLAADGAGRLDVAALETTLRGLGGAPAIVLATAGEVNAGDFDPIDRLATLAADHNAWLHVDGAFGLFARLTPRVSGLADGVERAHSVAADGHKWLNVPYDCGFAFVGDPESLTRTFTLAASYLPAESGESFGFMSPESSRRARGIATWATLRAYGRAGYRDLVERHLDLAQRLARNVAAADDFELLAPVPLNIVCFRYRPAGLGEDALDDLNARLGEALLVDGRVYVGTTQYDGKVAFRPAIVNWRTRDEDVDLIVDVIRELGTALP